MLKLENYDSFHCLHYNSQTPLADFQMENQKAEFKQGLENVSLVLFFTFHSKGPNSDDIFFQNTCYFLKTDTLYPCHQDLSGLKAPGCQPIRQDTVEKR